MFWMKQQVKVCKQIFFYRLRNETVYKDIWALVNDTLSKSIFRVKSSRTISGEEEAHWAWIAANYHQKTLKVNLIIVND